MLLRPGVSLSLSPSLNHLTRASAAAFFLPELLLWRLLTRVSLDAVSFGYVCGDTVDKAYKEYSEGKGLAAAGKMGFDVLLWQSLASVAVPGLTINLAVSLCREVLLLPAVSILFCVFVKVYLLRSQIIGCDTGSKRNWWN